jgi:hypothetical protein
MTRKLISACNLPRKLCQFALGHDHSARHRLGAGLVIMGVGVFIAKVGGDVHVYGLHYVLDLAGYLVHGIGAVPFVDYLVATEESSGE